MYDVSMSSEYGTVKLTFKNMIDVRKAVKRLTKAGRDSFRCLDCRKSTFHGDYYMLTDTLWARIHPADEGMLCIPCVEKRLGRRLRPNDFAKVPINEIEAVYNKRLASRLYPKKRKLK